MAETLPFQFLAGQASLDFLNTEPVAGGEQLDLLPDFDALAGWSVESGLAEADAVRALQRGASHASQLHAWQEAVALRETWREAVERFAAGRGVTTRAMDAINALLQRRRTRTLLVRGKEGLQRRESLLMDAPGDLLVPLAESAAALLTGADPALVRRCEAHDCVFWFLDTTKNHKRRWCSMSVCGNRAKVAAHYRRQRAAE